MTANPDDKKHICSALKHLIPWEERPSIEERSPSNWSVDTSVISGLKLLKGQTHCGCATSWAGVPECLRKHGRKHALSSCIVFAAVPDYSFLALSCCPDFLAGEDVIGPFLPTLLLTTVFIKTESNENALQPVDVTRSFCQLFRSFPTDVWIPM